VFAPLMGALADRFGVGPALTLLGALTLVLFLFVRVSPSSSPQPANQ